MDDKFLIGAYWRLRPVTLREYIAALKEYLRDLQNIHPVFRDLSESGSKPNDLKAITQNFENLESVALERAYSPTSKKYSNIDAKGRPTLDSVSATGYGLQFETSAPFDQRTIVSVCVGATSAYVPNAVTITFRKAGPAEFRDPAFIRRLLAVVVTRWHPYRALATHTSFNRLNMNRKTMFSIGWLSYFADPRVGESLPTGTHHEPFGDGGVLVTVSKEIATADNAKNVAAAKAIAEALTQKGFMTYGATTQT